MKTNMKLFIAALMLGLCFQSCSKDNLESEVLQQTETNETENEAIASGTVSIKALLREVILPSSGKPPTLEETLDNMIVQIADEFRLEVLSSNYRDLPEFIELPVDSYQMVISNYNALFNDARFDEPMHGSEVINFTISESVNTELNASLRLLDVATTMNMSSEILSVYPDITIGAEVVNPSVTQNLLTWTGTENGRTGYLSLVEYDFGSIGVVPVISDLTITISTTNTSGIPVNVTQTYPNVSPNEHYIISIERATPSSISLNVTLEDEVVINEIITL